MVNELRGKYQGTKVKLKGKLLTKKDKSISGPGVIEVTEITGVCKD